MRKLFSTWQQRFCLSRLCRSLELHRVAARRSQLRRRARKRSFRRCGSLHGHGSRSVSLRREGTIPVERWRGYFPARSAIGLAHPSAWPDLDRHRWCRLGSAMGGPVQVIRKGDVVWIPAGVKHWHGATPTTTMTHIAFRSNWTAEQWTGWKRSRTSSTGLRSERKQLAHRSNRRSRTMPHFVVKLWPR